MKARPALCAALFLAVTTPVMAQSVPAEDEQEADPTKTLESVVVTGTRVSGRSATYSAAPIDVIGPDQLQRSGSSELNQALSIALPSFNFPRPGLADGTDTVRPATLRGLSPDQGLVLLNSKRRHAAALVNVNGTVGRGAAAVDLNTIPTLAIRSVEVLRDGASAQYGSDAIAGVINLLLRRDDSGGGASFSYGVRDTAFSFPVAPTPTGATWTAPGTMERKRNDGETMALSGWQGFTLGQSGFLTLTTEFKKQQNTERDGYDSRQQYPLISGQFDPREVTIDRFNGWYGEPELRQNTLFANAGIDLDDGARLYGWASFQDRTARSAGFFRRALDTRNVLEIYPDGFLPIIAPDVRDLSLAFGGEWQWGDWYMDSSLVFGRNRMAFTIEDTLNTSIGPDSKTEFDAGGFAYAQSVLNLSGVRSVDVASFASPLNVAAGIEARRENYSIFAGEPDSYRFGGRLVGGQPAAPGAQVFPGFRPENEVDRHRHAIGAYIDLEANPTEKLLTSVAARAERYSDFGSNLTGKLSLRYDFTSALALRGSLQNGFRAPSPQQQYFTATSTNFINGVPFDITTFPATDPVATALGAKPLDAEESLNGSLGFVFNGDRFALTVDAYRIDIDNRIVLSENLVQSNVRAYLTSLGFTGIGGGRFFINGVDTETRGVDAVASWRLESDIGQFDFTLAGNWNKTQVTRVPVTNELQALNPAPTLFGRVNVLTLERGTPRDKLSAGMNWNKGRWSTSLRATRYGEVLDPGTSEAFDVVLGPKILIDVEARFKPTERLELALGADNLGDAYPDAHPLSRNTTGNTPYSNFSPFGRSGRLLFARVSVSY